MAVCGYGSVSVSDDIKPKRLFLTGAQEAVRHELEGDMVDAEASPCPSSASVTHLILRFFTKASMVIFSMRMKSPSPTVVWSAMVALYSPHSAPHSSPWPCAAAPARDWQLLERWLSR